MKLKCEEKFAIISFSFYYQYSCFTFFTCLPGNLWLRLHWLHLLGCLVILKHFSNLILIFLALRTTPLAWIYFIVLYYSFLFGVDAVCPFFLTFKLCYVGFSDLDSPGQRIHLGFKYNDNAYSNLI